MRICAQSAVALLILLAPGSAKNTLHADDAAMPYADARSEAGALPVGKWVALFNGKDLTGWTPKVRFHDLAENPGDTFRVRDGLLQVRYDGAGYGEFNETFGHLFFQDEFSHYRLRVEYRFVGEQCAGGPGWALRNSGVMIHGQAPETMGKDQRFPVSIEVQLLGGNGREARTTSNLCTPGTNVVMDGKLRTQHCTSSTSKTYHGEQWVIAEIEVHGSQVIRHLLEGDVVLEYNDPQLDPKDDDARPLIKDNQLLLDHGSISVQSESHPVDFRRIEIMVLNPE